LRLRSEIPQQYKWDAESIYPSREAWEAEIQYVEGKLPELSKFQGRLGEGPQTLLEWFEAAEDVMKRVGKILVYATLHYTVDTQDQGAAAMNDRARSLIARAMAAGAFAEPEILAVGMEALRRWMEEEPKLAIYEHYFDKLYRRRAHVRSPEVEELLSQVMDPFRTAASVHGILSDADLRFRPAKNSKGEELEVAQGTIGKLLGDPDREVRRTAWESYCDAYLQFKNTTANCIAAGVKQNVFLARARKYDSALEAALYPNNVPVEVFHNLIEVYRRSLGIWHRYWRLRRKALQFDTLHVYDTRAPLTRHQPEVPFERAVEWISEGIEPLGSEYVETMRRGVLEERWVDVYPNQGKRMGAFSSGTQGTHPFILMSYNDDLFSLSTLAHELGHSMHSYYTWKTQPFVYARYSIFAAEVASNFNQALVRDYLLRTHQDDPEFQIAVIEEAMANFHRYFFIMPTLARFEREIHERVWRGEPLTAESLIELMARLFEEGYGRELELDRERVGITWAQFPTHLYANFYVYQYATGISGAHALAERVLAGEPEAAASYVEFLNAGGSLYPLEALKRAGVDLTSPEPVEQAFGVLDRYVKRLEELTAKSGG
jgi:oligoendopeptidase F